MPPEEQPPRRRRTIQDIAAEAGVSVASVSYALNGKPGVSAETRERILQIARQHTWEPNHQARALHRARNDIVGFVAPVSGRALSEESFWMLFISGLEHELRLNGRSLLLHTEENLAEEMRIYRRWSSRGAVDAVVLTDLKRGDVRPHLLRELGLPAVLAGLPDDDVGFHYCYASDTSDMEALLQHLHELGLRRLARLGGDPDYLFVGERDEACARFVREHDMPEMPTWHTGFLSPDSVREAVHAFLALEPRPEAIVADSDLLAVRALQELTACSIAVPSDIQLASFDDSALCSLVSPPLTALDRQPHELGRIAARLAVGDEHPQRILRVPDGILRPRASTAPVG